MAAVAAVFIASLFFVESPTETRNRKYDNAILDKFNQIDNAINTYYFDNKKLPENLDDLTADIIYLDDKNFNNPSTGKKFVYNRIATSTYELCADFITSNKEGDEISLGANIWKDLDMALFYKDVRFGNPDTEMQLTGAAVSYRF